VGGEGVVFGEGGWGWGEVVGVGWVVRVCILWTRGWGCGMLRIAVVGFDAGFDI